LPRPRRFRLGDLQANPIEEKKIRGQSMPRLGPLRLGRPRLGARARGLSLVDRLGPGQVVRRVRFRFGLSLLALPFCGCGRPLEENTLGGRLCLGEEIGELPLV
jgi:hypothetical protein